MVPTKPDFQPCPEDDDFMAALDKMVNENIAESKNIGEPKKYLTRPISDHDHAALRSAGQESAERADGAGGRRQGEEELGAAAAGEHRGRGRAQDRGGPGGGQCAVTWSLHLLSVQVQVMLRRGAKGGAGVRSVQVN